MGPGPSSRAFQTNLVINNWWCGDSCVGEAQARVKGKCGGRQISLGAGESVVWGLWGGNWDFFFCLKIS